MARGCRGAAWLEPVLVLALAPVFWFPRWWSVGLLLIIPLFWLARWLARGRVSARTPYDPAAVVVVLTLPLTLVPVVQWDLAVPKLAGVLLGIVLVYAVANGLTDRTAIVVAAYATVVVLGGGIGFAGLIGTEWTLSKVASIDWVYQRLPLLISGLTSYGARGAFHPNEIGGALALLLPLGLALAYGSWRCRSGIAVPAILGVMSGFMVLVLLLTLSRSAFIGTGIGALLVLGWVVVSVRCSARWRAPLLTILGLAAVAVGATAVRLASAWMSVTRTGIDSFPTRIELWSHALYMIADFPLTGIGMGQFPLLFQRFYMPLLLSADVYVPHAHNFLLQLVLDLGVIGAGAILWLLVAFYRACWCAYRATHLTGDVVLQALAVGLAAGMTSFLVYGLTDTIVIGARGGIGFWLVLGLAAALARGVVAGHCSSDPKQLERAP